MNAVRPVDVSREFFAGSFVNIGTIDIAPRDPEDTLNLDGCKARIRITSNESVIMSEDDPAGVLVINTIDKTLEIKIPVSLNAELLEGRNDVVIWIVFNPGADEEPEELAAGVWTKKTAA